MNYDDKRFSGAESDGNHQFLKFSRPAQPPTRLIFRSWQKAGELHRISGLLLSAREFVNTFRIVMST